MCVGEMISQPNDTTPVRTRCDIISTYLLNSQIRMGEHIAASTMMPGRVR